MYLRRKFFKEYTVYFTGILILFLSFSACNSKVYKGYQNKQQNYSVLGLIGDWKTNDELSINGVKIHGLKFINNSGIESENTWITEGVMSANIDFWGTHHYASSFDYKVIDSLLLMKITFSASGLKKGAIYKFKYKMKKSDLILMKGKKEYIFERD